MRRELRVAWRVRCGNVPRHRRTTDAAARAAPKGSASSELARRCRRDDRRLGAPKKGASLGCEDVARRATNATKRGDSRQRICAAGIFQNRRWRRRGRHAAGRDARAYTDVRRAPALHTVAILVRRVPPPPRVRRDRVETRELEHVVNAHVVAASSVGVHLDDARACRPRRPDVRQAARANRGAARALETHGVHDAVGGAALGEREGGEAEDPPRLRALGGGGGGGGDGKIAQQSRRATSTIDRRDRPASRRRRSTSRSSSMRCRRAPRPCDDVARAAPAPAPSRRRRPTRSTPEEGKISNQDASHPGPVRRRCPADRPPSRGPRCTVVRQRPPARMQRRGTRATGPRIVRTCRGRWKRHERAGDAATPTADSSRCATTPGSISTAMRSIATSTSAVLGGWGTHRRRRRVRPKILEGIQHARARKTLEEKKSLRARDVAGNGSRDTHGGSLLKTRARARRERSDISRPRRRRRRKALPRRLILLVGRRAFASAAAVHAASHQSAATRPAAGWPRHGHRDERDSVGDDGRARGAARARATAACPAPTADRRMGRPGGADGADRVVRQGQLRIGDPRRPAADPTRRRTAARVSPRRAGPSRASKGRPNILPKQEVRSEPHAAGRLPSAARRARSMARFARRSCPHRVLDT